MRVIAGLAAFKSHLSYLPHSGSVLARVADKTLGYTQTKSALHFPVDERHHAGLAGVDTQAVTCLQVAACLSFGRVADVFDALGASARRAILDVLAERDDQTLFEICGRLAADHDVDLTRQAISQHLAVLEAAGLVRSRRDGRYKFHSIDAAPLRAVMSRWLHEENVQ